MSDTHEKFYNAVRGLSDFLGSTDFNDPDSVKRTNNYFEWLHRKTDIIKNEAMLTIPLSCVPVSISEYVYNKLDPVDKTYTDSYYKQGNPGSNYSLDTSVTLNATEIEKLVKTLVLVRGNVVWVEFGFNIGKEFGGKHPALILKSTGDSLVVAPLSSQAPTSVKPYHVKVEKVYYLQPRVRWANVLRIQPVSLHRVDFSSPYGSVKGSVLNDIKNAIKVAGIN